MDIQPGAADVTLDLRRGLPFESNCCELVVSEHCFEHFDYPEPIGHLFRECLRVLRPGGCLRFSVPDSEWPLNDYGDGLEAPYFKACAAQDWHPREWDRRVRRNPAGTVRPDARFRTSSGRQPLCVRVQTLTQQ